MDNIGKAEILQIVDSVSRERGIPKAKLMEAMEWKIYICVSCYLQVNGAVLRI